MILEVGHTIPKGKNTYLTLNEAITSYVNMRRYLDFMWFDEVFESPFDKNVNTFANGNAFIRPPLMNKLSKSALFHLSSIDLENKTTDEINELLELSLEHKLKLIKKEKINWKQTNPILLSTFHTPYYGFTAKLSVHHENQLFLGFMDNSYKTSFHLYKDGKERDGDETNMKSYASHLVAYQKDLDKVHKRLHRINNKKPTPPWMKEKPSIKIVDNKIDPWDVDFTDYKEVLR